MSESSFPAPDTERRLALAEHLKHLGLIHSTLLVAVAVVLSLCFAAGDAGTDLVLEAHLMKDIWSAATDDQIGLFTIDTKVQADWRAEVVKTLQSDPRMANADVTVDKQVGGKPYFVFAPFPTAIKSNLDCARSMLTEAMVRVAIYTGKLNESTVTALLKPSREGDYRGFSIRKIEVLEPITEAQCSGGTATMKFEGQLTLHDTNAGTGQIHYEVKAKAPFECRTVVLRVDVPTRFPQIDRAWDSLRFVHMDELVSRAHQIIQKRVDAAAPPTTVLGVAIRPAHLATLAPLLIVAIQLYLLAFVLDAVRLAPSITSTAPTVWIGALSGPAGRVLAYVTLAVLPSVSATLASYLFGSRSLAAFIVFATSFAIGALTYRICRAFRRW
jgi:hypothetical protein